MIHARRRPEDARDEYLDESRLCRLPSASWCLHPAGADTAENKFRREAKAYDRWGDGLGDMRWGKITLSFLLLSRRHYPCSQET